MEQVIPLTDLTINTTAQIDHINCAEHIKRRFLDLGIIPETTIIPVFKSVAGDPIAYEIRDTLLAIRYQDAKDIFVKCSSGDAKN